MVKDGNANSQTDACPRFDETGGEKYLNRLVSRAKRASLDPYQTRWTDAPAPTDTIGKPAVHTDRKTGGHRENGMASLYFYSWLNAITGEAARDPRPYPPEQMSGSAAIVNALQSAMSGYRKWQSAPEQEEATYGETLWQQGSTHIRATSPMVETLLLPSLINNAGILDLTPHRSLFRYLDHTGGTALVDWGRPTYEERHFLSTPISNVCAPPFSISGGRST